MPHVIPKAEEANTILRSPYTRMVRPERQVMVTSMTHYLGGHTIEEELYGLFGWKGKGGGVKGSRVMLTKNKLILY